MCFQIKGKTLIYYHFLGLAIISCILLVSGCKSNPICPDCTPLESAVANSDYAQVKALLPNEKNINQPLTDGETLLHYSATRTNVEIAELLLDAGADLSAKNSNHETPLHTAIRYGSENIALLFIDRGADVNAIIPNGPSILTKAAARKNLELVQRIVEKGADPTLPDGRGETPLFAAAERGSDDIFNYLLGRVSQQNAGIQLDKSLLFAAVNRNSIGITQSVIRAGVSPNEETSHGVTALMIASYNGYEDLVKLLIDLGADPLHSQSESGNALHAALLRGHTNIAQYLVDQGAQPVNLPTTVFSTYASAIAHQMVGERQKNKNSEQAKGLLTKSVQLYQKTIEKGEAVHDQAGSDIWKIRFTELLQYTGIAFSGVNPTAYTSNTSNIHSHLAVQDMKDGLKGVQQRVEEIIVDSKQRIKICETFIAAL